MSYDVGRRHGSDLALAWLWCRLAAVASIRSLAWEPPYVSGVALKRQKDKKKRHLIIDLICISMISEVGPIFMFISHLEFTPEFYAYIF